MFNVLQPPSHPTGCPNRLHRFGTCIRCMQPLKPTEVSQCDTCRMAVEEFVRERESTSYKEALIKAEAWRPPPSDDKFYVVEEQGPFASGMAVAGPFDTFEAAQATNHVHPQGAMPLTIYFRGKPLGTTMSFYDVVIKRLRSMGCSYTEAWSLYNGTRGI